MYVCMYIKQIQINNCLKCILKSMSAQMQACRVI